MTDTLRGLAPGTEITVSQHPDLKLNGYWRILGQDKHTKLVQLFKAGDLGATEEERASWEERLDGPSPLAKSPVQHPKVSVKGSGRMVYPDKEECDNAKS